MEMILTVEQVNADISALPENYKTGDIDRLIRRYVKEKADASLLRPYILEDQKLHRIYYYVFLKKIKSVEERMDFIHNNLLFSDWWHTDQLINFVSEMDFDTAMQYAKEYTISEDPFIRRWGYVMFISKLGRNKAQDILNLIHNDEHYYVQMGEAWLIAEMAVFEPDYVYQWLQECDLNYNIAGKAIQKINDSFRISAEWKKEYKKLRAVLKVNK